MEIAMKLSKRDTDLIELKNKIKKLMSSNSNNHLKEIISKQYVYAKGKSIHEMSKMR